MTISWPFSRQQVLDADGRPYLVPSVNFFAAGTTDPLVVYRDPALSQPWTQPVIADGFGRFPRVYLPAGLYREQVFGPYGDELWFDDGLGEAAASVDEGAGGGSDPTGGITTGDVKWRADASIQPGWVRMNGRTVGGAGSGATELADASAKALFVYLWSTFSEAFCPVIGGRGTAAADDFAAGKQITILSMRGLVPGGLDDMGSTADNRLQVQVQAQFNAGANSATVADGNRIALGMTVVAPGVPTGTTVTNRNGNTITLSNAATASGSVNARFSYFPDTQTPGVAGGDFLQGVAVSNLPSILPNGSVAVPYPGQSYARNDTLAAASLTTGTGSTTISNLLQGLVTATTGAGTTANLTVSNANPGGGIAVSTLQPTRLGTFYMKV